MVLLKCSFLLVMLLTGFLMLVQVSARSHGGSFKLEDHDDTSPAQSEEDGESKSDEAGLREDSRADEAALITTSKPDEDGSQSDNDDNSDDKSHAASEEEHKSIHEEGSRHVEMKKGFWPKKESPSGGESHSGEEYRSDGDSRSGGESRADGESRSDRDSRADDESLHHDNPVDGGSRSGNTADFKSGPDFKEEDEESKGKSRAEATTEVDDDGYDRTSDIDDTEGSDEFGSNQNVTGDSRFGLEMLAGAAGPLLGGAASAVGGLLNNPITQQIVGAVKDTAMGAIQTGIQAVAGPVQQKVQETVGNVVGGITHQILNPRSREQQQQQQQRQQQQQQVDPVVQQLQEQQMVIQQQQQQLVQQQQMLENQARKKQKRKPKHRDNDDEEAEDDDANEDDEEERPKPKRKHKNKSKKPKKKTKEEDEGDGDRMSRLEDSGDGRLESRDNLYENRPSGRVTVVGHDQETQEKGDKSVEHGLKRRRRLAVSSKDLIGSPYDTKDQAKFPSSSALKSSRSTTVDGRRGYY